MGRDTAHFTRICRRLAAVQTGDLIRLDIEQRTLEILVSEEELKARLARWRPRPRRFRRGYYTMFLDHILQAHEGCDFDFLRAGPAMSRTNPRSDGRSYCGLTSGSSPERL